jgi:NitT/TauT family transport system substrate-binding protein
MKERGMVLGGDAAKSGIGSMNPERLKQTYDYLVGQKLLDPAKVDLQSTYNTNFLQEAKVMP